MAILLTNDDGVDAPGIRELAAALAGLDDLHVAAPDENKSGVGHGITLTRNLRARRRPAGASGEARWSVDGTPADAAKFGLQHVLGGVPPRLVVSGINFGPNIGVNVRCSGTVGAAFEAVSAGVNALAVSVEYVTPTNWAAAKRYARKVALMMLDLPPGGEPFVLNLNVPSVNPEEIRGLVIARHGSGGVRDSIVVEERGDVFHLEADWIQTPSDGDCDASAFLAGYAVLTPLRFEMTDDSRMAFLAKQWAGEARLFTGDSQ